MKFLFSLLFLTGISVSAQTDFIGTFTGNGAGLTNLPSFTSTNITIDNSSTIYQVAHGLGATPKFVRCVLHCVHADPNTGDVAGDETDCHDFFESGFSSTAGAGISALRANAPNLIFSVGGTLLGNEGNFEFATRSGASMANPQSFTNFVLKFYAQL